MLKPTVPAAVSGLPNSPRPPIRFPLVDDFNGAAGELLAAILACRTARERLAVAISNREVRRG